ncbi:MAG: PTS sugar transporter subunit IIA [Clostridiales bacterium]|nr:PTS sugar transporter subunit IIA [Clostridiales bacterium]
MTGLLVTGHGHFATGLASTLKLIAGTMEHIVYVDFEEDHSTEILTKNLNHGLDELGSCSGVLILADLAGGSPFKTAVECKYARPEQKIEVLAGTNLPMLITAASLVETDCDLPTMAETVMTAGKEYIMRYQMTEHTDNIDDDGI